MNPQKKWIVVYFKDGEVATPVWEVERKIRPTRWANQAFKGWDMTYKIMRVEKFSEDGYKDSFLKALSGTP
jgi:hypothetical protein